jgi:citrate synthase
MERVMLREKNLYPNVDFPAAAIYYMMGIPIPLYTPIFAAARIVGWSAHIIEQHDNNRLIRPRSDYNGARDLKFVPIDQRG